MVQMLENGKNFMGKFCFCDRFTTKVFMVKIFWKMVRISWMIFFFWDHFTTKNSLMVIISWVNFFLRPLYYKKIFYGQNFFEKWSEFPGSFFFFFWDHFTPKNFFDGRDFMVKFFLFDRFTSKYFLWSKFFEIWSEFSG